MFRFRSVLINRGTKYDRTAPMTREHTRYGEIIADVRSDIGQQVWSEGEPASLQIRLKAFKKCW